MLWLAACLKDIIRADILRLLQPDWAGQKDAKPEVLTLHQLRSCFQPCQYSSLQSRALDFETIMHAPSPQLLRALRTSLSIATTTGFPRASLPISRQYTTTTNIILPSTRRHNSSQTPRPTRMIPRAHTAKPSPNARLPEAKEDNPGADLNALNVLGNVPAPTTAVEACLDNGFHLDNGLKVRGGDGVLLVGGEAFAWRPWSTKSSKAEMVNRKGQFAVDEEVWGLLGVVWPRPGEFFFFFFPSIYLSIVYTTLLTGY